MLFVSNLKLSAFSCPTTVKVELSPEVPKFTSLTVSTTPVPFALNVIFPFVFVELNVFPSSFRLSTNASENDSGNDPRGAPESVNGKNPVEDVVTPVTFKLDFAVN
jgi:hypothetical protein